MIPAIPPPAPGGDRLYRVVGRTVPRTRVAGRKKKRSREGHDQPLQQRRAGAPDEASTDYEEADPVDERVSEYVEGVREQRAGARKDPGPKLDDEQEGIDREASRLR